MSPYLLQTFVKSLALPEICFATSQGGRAETMSPKDTALQNPCWQFSVLMEEPSVERAAGTLCGYAVFFQFRILCHERRPYKDRYAGCKEYTWKIRRRFSDFQELDDSLRDTGLLPLTVALPPKTFWQHLCPSAEFVSRRSEELHAFLVSVLQVVSVQAAVEPELADAADLCCVLPRFLGLKRSEDSKGGHDWALPKEAVERTAALVHTLDRGIFVWAHADLGILSSTRLTKHERLAVLGDLPCTHCEVPVKRKRSPLDDLEKSDIGGRGRSWTEDSTASVSTVASVSEIKPYKSSSLPAVWLEIDLDKESARAKEHGKWWAQVLEAQNSEAKAIKGASKVDCRLPSEQQVEDRKETRLKAITEFEQAAALWRELSVVHEDLQTVLGYGVEGKTFVLVQEAEPSFRGLRSVPFTQQRCYRVLGQALQALSKIHEQHMCHGHISPESLLVEEGPLGPQVRLAWTPGQRRLEGHVSATLGFKGPGPDQSPAGDMWSLACVILVWWMGFDPVPHPWTQFGKSARLKQAIQDALAQQPPAMPKALLDLHLAAASADEPSHTFLSLLAQLLTRCLEWDPTERPSPARLLKHSFFELAL